MKYFRPQSYYDSGTWRGTQAMDGGGALMNQGIHGVDLVRYLMGPADSIYALSGTLVRDIEVEDTLTAVVAWHCGAQGVIQASVGDYPGFPRRIERRVDVVFPIVDRLDDDRKAELRHEEEHRAEGERHPEQQSRFGL